jgi:hypothetical protein
MRLNLYCMRLNLYLHAIEVELEYLCCGVEVEVEYLCCGVEMGKTKKMHSF